MKPTLLQKIKMKKILIKLTIKHRSAIASGRQSELAAFERERDEEFKKHGLVFEDPDTPNQPK